MWHLIIQNRGQRWKISQSFVMKFVWNTFESKSIILKKYFSALKKNRKQIKKRNSFWKIKIIFEKLSRLDKFEKKNLNFPRYFDRTWSRAQHAKIFWFINCSIYKGSCLFIYCLSWQKLKIPKQLAFFLTFSFFFPHEFKTIFLNEQ